MSHISTEAPTTHQTYSHTEPASEQAITYGWLKAAYKHGIEYTTIDRGTRGVFLLGGLGMFAITSFATKGGIEFYMMPGRILLIDWLLLIPLTVAFFGVGVFALLWYGRRELFRPIDAPILFDKMHRKVYRLHQPPLPGWRGALQRWPVVVTTHEWDDIEAQHHVITSTTGSTLTRHHHLILMVKNPEFVAPEAPKKGTSAKRRAALAAVPTPPGYVDGFALGDPLTLSETSTPMVWEHLRRYMNEGGPALPPGESVGLQAPPQGFWQTMGAVSIFGPDYLKWWRESPGITAFMHLLLPLFLPLALAMAAANWLSYKTAVPVQWPREVLDAVGERVV